MSPTGLALAFVGSLLPDIDHPSLRVERRSWPISTLVSGVFGHRSITHSVLTAVALIVVLMHSGYAHAITPALAEGIASDVTRLCPFGGGSGWA
ncbi:MAG: metal-dependent hydrolase [Janthinobacterium lividum]